VLIAFGALHPKHQGMPDYQRDSTTVLLRRTLIDHARPSELNMWPAVVVAVLVFAGTVAGGMLTQHLTGTQALRLLDAMMPTVRFFTSAVMTVAATTLALMLTLLSLSFNAGSRLNAVHYRRLRQVALVDCATFVAASLFMIVLLVSVPLERTAVVPASWFDGFYLFVVGMSGALGGLLAGIVVMLFGALHDMIDVLALGKHDGRLVSIERQD
jgi:hypothetical protein